MRPTWVSISPPKLLDWAIAYTSRGLPSFISLYFVLFLGQGFITYPWLV